MKKITLLLFGILLGFQSFSQEPDPELFRKWNLYKMEFDFAGTLYIEEIDPPINPYLTINQNLSFEGFGACNSFSGNFTFQGGSYPSLTPYDFLESTETCQTEFHDDFELYYFLYFSQNAPQNFNIEISPVDNLYHLYMGQGTSGDWLEFIEGGPLSVVENDSENFKIYPNPVSDHLFINSEKPVIGKMSIFSTSGQKILQMDGNASAIDVSSLSKGMYFLEIISEEGISLQKFIKK